MATKQMQRRREKHLVLFEKEKGGVGSTGSLVTLAQLLHLRSTPVMFIEASLSQSDVANAYGDHHVVEQIDLTREDAPDQVIDVVTAAPDGAYILANIPGGRAAELDAIHQTMIFAKSAEEFDAMVSVVWTMGLDAASAITLATILDGELPGPLHLNLPIWHGSRAKFMNLDDDLIARATETGGQVFATPKLPTHLYDCFRTYQMPLDRLREGGLTLGNKVALSMWEKGLEQALGGVFA